MFREFLNYLRLELYRSRHTVEAYSADLHGFKRYMSQTGVITDDAGCFMPGDVRPSHIRGWIAALSEEGMSARSIRRKVQSVRSYFRYLSKRNPELENPATELSLPKAGKKLPEFARHDELNELIAATEKSRDRLILMLLYGCGLRRSELLAINDSDISRSRKELRVTGKGNKTRVIPLPEPLLEEIEAYQRERDSEFEARETPRPLFMTSRGRLSQSGLYKIVRNLLGPTTASKKSPHTLRHTFATTLLNSGADINSVKELLGHSSLGATQIYTHVAFSEMKRDWAKAHPRGRKERERKEGNEQSGENDCF